ncbi:hypothetical protein ACIPL1_27490 [Pseudomonas sp. NPDC090202]|uniref:hypothetical protein n=1 Tax=Pseudomonas sp. NPDC090202 TaxID=3364476 RepID=UPI003800433D
MAECTDYALTPEQAATVAAIVQVPFQQRVSMLADYARDHGTNQLVWLFAQFMGMANSVVDNCRNMTDLVMVCELNVNPDRFDSVNLPTILGACQGVELAAGCDPAGACEGCAYRLGTMANQSPIATSDAAFMSFNQKGFMCHAETDERGNATKVCIGHAKAFKQRESEHDE